jgi:hypothetical protein
MLLDGHVPRKHICRFEGPGVLFVHQVTPNSIADVNGFKRVARGFGALQGNIILTRDEK